MRKKKVKSYRSKGQVDAIADFKDESWSTDKENEKSLEGGDDEGQSLAQNAEGTHS